jgi:hypothetical protein
VVTTIEQRFRLRVRAPFTAEFSCEREKAAAPCLPIRPMTVRFSAPVPRTLAAQARLQPSSGEALAPVFDKDDKASELTEIAFPQTARRERAYSVVLPPTQGQRRPAARQREQLSAQGPDRRGAADRQVRGGAVRRGRAQRRRDGAGDPAPCAGRAARRRSAAASAPAASSAGQVRVKRLQGDAEILQWYAKLQKYHETQLTARSSACRRASGSPSRTTPTPRAGRSSARSSAASARARSRC